MDPSSDDKLSFIILLSPHFYDAVGVRRIMNLLLRMTTDPIIGDVKSLLGSTMVALLDIIPAEDWDQEVRLIGIDLVMPARCLFVGTGDTLLTTDFFVLSVIDFARIFLAHLERLCPLYCFYCVSSHRFR